MKSGILIEKYQNVIKEGSYKPLKNYFANIHLRPEYYQKLLDILESITTKQQLIDCMSSLFHNVHSRLQTHYIGTFLSGFWKFIEAKDQLLWDTIGALGGWHPDGRYLHRPISTVDKVFEKWLFSTKVYNKTLKDTGWDLSTLEEQDGPKKNIFRTWNLSGDDDCVNKIVQILQQSNNQGDIVRVITDLLQELIKRRRGEDTNTFYVANRLWEVIERKDLTLWKVILAQGTWDSAGKFSGPASQIGINQAKELFDKWCIVHKVYRKTHQDTGWDLSQL